MKKIILASGSPRRKQLLEWAEIPFEVVVPEIDEHFPEHLSPEQAASHISVNKAREVSAMHKNSIIVAADTIVVLDNIIIGKPIDREDAIRILASLSGRSHKVITAVCIISDEQQYDFAEITTVTFNELSPDQVNHYVDNYKPYDKAGAYAIQEWIGVIGIKSISGDFYNVMGLPVSRVVKALIDLQKEN